jgi:hypothetical protein
MPVLLNEIKRPRAHRKVAAAVQPFDIAKLCVDSASVGLDIRRATPSEQTVIQPQELIVI